MSRQRNPGVRLDNLRIEGELRNDYHSILYLARDLDLDVRRAVREYLPWEWGELSSGGIVGPRRGCDEYYRRGLTRFWNGARILARVRHRNVIRAHHVYKARGTVCMVMEYIEGRTLEATLEDTGPMPEALVQKILTGLIDGLSVLHAAGLVHGGINPANIILRSNGTPVLIAFDFATGWTRQGEGDLPSPRSPYLPTLGPSPEEPGTDIYALGAVAYEALSGRVPDYALERRRWPSVADVAVQSVSAALAAAVDAALAPDWQNRPQSLDEWRAMRKESGNAGGKAARPAARGQAGGDPEATGGFEEVEFVSSGTLFDVFRARFSGRAVYVKCVTRRAERRAGRGSLWQEGNTTNWFIRSGMGWVERPVARPGHVHYEAALRAECEVINTVATYWNHPGATLARARDGQLAGPGAEICLVMPECRGTPLERFSRDEQRQWIPRMLPALWRALARCPHGDLNAGDLLIDPSRRFFGILDPGVRIEGPSDSTFRFYSTLFTTNATHYALLLPEHGPARPRLCAPYGGLRRQLESWHRQVAWLIEARDSGRPAGKEQWSDGVSPAAADLIALGAMYACTLGAAPLHEMLGLDEPLWSRARERGVFDAERCGYLKHEPTADERHCIEVIEGGELSRALQRRGATSSEAELCVGLIALRIDSAEELAAYCDRT